MNESTDNDPMSDPVQDVPDGKEARGLVFTVHTPIYIGQRNEIYQRYPGDKIEVAIMALGRRTVDDMAQASETVEEFETAVETAVRTNPLATNWYKAVKTASSSEAGNKTTPGLSRGPNP